MYILVFKCIDVLSSINILIGRISLSVVRHVLFHSISCSMSKSIVKKALEILDDEEKKPRTKFNAIKKKKNSPETPSIIQDRKQLARTCAQLKKLSKPVVTSDQIEQLNNYRFGGPSKRSSTKKKEEEEQSIFTEEDFQRFQNEYNPPVRKS